MYFPKDSFPPASLEKLTLFIAHRFRQCLAASTVNTYISVRSYYHKLGNYQDLTQNFIVRKTLNGYEKLRSAKDTRLPITSSILKMLLNSLNFTTKSYFIRMMLNSMYLLAFHAFLRVGEITGCTPPKGNCLCANTIKFNLDNNNQPISIHLHMSQFKHSDRKHLPILVLQRNLDNSEICPVMALWTYWQFRKHSNLEEPLFSFMDGSQVSRHFFSEQLQLSLKYSSLDKHNYKGHSFRIGAATTAAMLGISEEKIQMMGRWHSNAFKKYIRIPTLNLS